MAQSQGLPLGPVAGAEAFRELRARIQDAGLLDVRPRYYAWKITLNTILLALGWLIFFALGATWWQLVVAAYLGFWFVQTGLIGHDAGHRQIARSRRGTKLLGLLHGNLLLGMSYGWWIRHHTQHHNEPNHLERDPDILRRPAIFTPEQASSRRGFARFVARNQGWVFFPLKLVESVGLRTASIRTIRDKDCDNPRGEAALIGIHFALFLGAIFYVLPLGMAIVFVLVHQATFGFYMGIAFATNHKGMPLVRDGEQWSWLEQQILTARNLRSNALVTFLYGGLNHQIEHHLFPMMPRPALREARPIVMAFCKEQGIPYHETGVWESYMEVVRHLASTSKQVDWDLVSA